MYQRTSSTRSADPSPQRTTRMSPSRPLSSSPSPSLGSGVYQAMPVTSTTVSSAKQYFRNHPEFATAVRNRQQEERHRILHQQAAKSLDDKGKSNPSINHQVVYVCHGHCSGPECEFTQSIRHWQSMVKLGDGQCFRSEVVEQAPMSLVKLEEKRRSLDKMKSVLRGKLESKQRHKEQRQKSRNSNSLKQNRATPSPVTRETQTPPIAPPQAPIVAQQTVATPEKRPVSSAASSTLSEQDVGEVIRTRHQQRRRTLSAGKKDGDVIRSNLRFGHHDPQSRPPGGVALSEVSAQDLLGKSHEELVLLLIHLRRQSAYLNEAIDATRDELQQMAEAGTAAAQDENKALLADLQAHVREMEEQRARSQPIVNLVDNMVKLGSLYRGPQDAPLSHRIRNLPSKQNPNSMSASSSNSSSSSHARPQQPQNALLEQEAEAEMQQRKADIQLRLLELYHVESEFQEERLNVKYLIEEKELLDRSMDQVKRNMGKESGNNNNSEESHEKQRQMLENELMRVSGQLELSHKRLDENSGEHSRWEHDLLFLRQQLQQSAARDMTHGLGRSAETLAIEGELAQVQQRAAELHRERQDIARRVQALNVRRDFLISETQQITTMKKEDSDRGNSGDREVAALTSGDGTLGDIGDADERVKKFYGIQQQQQQVTFSNNNNNNKQLEVKTVRMVKRDSKERSVSRSGGSNEEDDADSNGSSPDSSASTSSSTSAKPPSMSPPPPPPPMPKNLFQPNNNANSRIPNGTSEPKRRGQEVFSSASLPRKMNNSGLFGNLMGSNEGCGGSSSGADSGVFGSRNTLHGGSMGNGLQQRANFKLGDYYGRKPNGVQRPSSALSAHERLFGSSRESSMSPPTSPASNGSAMQSPVFKSDTARQIAQEVGKVGGPRRAKKQRSHTIGGGDGNPAVIEAMKAHQARMAARARDDLDMERALADDSSSNKAAPDVVRSTIDSKEPEDAIDTLFGAPKKISIPERYVPDSDADNVTPEERQIRLKKADSIRKMLADTAGPLAGEGSSRRDNVREAMSQEKKEREHLLALNQVIARQVMEKSRMVAVRAIAEKKFEQPKPKIRNMFGDDEDEENPLPLYQQRESMLT